MSKIDEIITKARALAYQDGVAALAEKSGVPERTLGRFLKSPPKQIDTLKRLEKIVDPGQPES